MYKQGSSVQEMSDTFKKELFQSMDKHIPAKEIRSKNSLPWITHKIRKMFKKKSRLYQQAKRTKNWSNYRHFQKEIKSQIRKAEWSYINDTILKGLESNNTKPFWKYIKSRKNDNIGVAPLKNKGKLISDSKGKAEILIQQFKSVFTIDKSTTIPDTTKHIEETIPNLIITEKGLEKLLKDID
ncbi:unnamed protein product [Mytilus edulis]|uniref:Endonuclease-reverse transcriptase n=1 Tax=Mytilus edulis TaxID=6550 RepID=A0A8S3QLQ3_MYTED|nr:unnamed protein product [Mytilus edulis]